MSKIKVQDDLFNVPEMTERDQNIQENFNTQTNLQNMTEDSDEKSFHWSAHNESSSDEEEDNATQFVHTHRATPEDRSYTSNA